MEKASFSITKYYFDKIAIDLDKYTGNDLFISIEPSGIFLPNKSQYELSFNFRAFDRNTEDKISFMNIQCKGIFKFENVHTIEEIPNFFYKNSIAILFPYLRSFVSIVSLHANTPPIMLPTMNLSSLETPLKENTKSN